MFLNSFLYILHIHKIYFIFMVYIDLEINFPFWEKIH